MAFLANRNLLYKIPEESIYSARVLFKTLSPLLSFGIPYLDLINGFHIPHSVHKMHAHIFLPLHWIILLQGTSVHIYNINNF